MAKIAGIGTACLDHLNIIDEYPQEDETGHILTIETQGGGQVATALVAASRLGHETHYIGTLGNDDIGRQIVEGLQAEGVQCHIEYKEMVSAHSELMIVPQHASRSKFVYMNTDPKISFDAAQTELIAGCDGLHLDGSDYENTMKAIEIAKANNVVTCIDGEYCQEDLSLNKQMDISVDLLIMSKRHALTVSGKKTIEEAVCYFGPLGPEVVIATCGSDGCFLYKDGKAVHYPAYKVEAIDTTGAGDVFHGAFLSAYLSSYDLDTCIRYASYVAAVKCTKVGGRAGIVSSVDINDL